ncbi:MAG: TonB-dependent receptor domain-containing protein [Pyrinomonadaceae bacterium]
MKKIIFGGLMLAISSLNVFAQNTGKISGKVVFGGDKSPLHDVSIKITELNKTTFTDAAGSFVFTNIPNGKYTLVAHQEGFADSKSTVTVSATTPAIANFEMVITGLEEQVTVTGSGTEETAFEAIATVTTLDSTQITTRAAVGLGDVLANEAGIAKRSGSAGSSRPVIRGFDGDRVMISSDGVSVGSLASQSGDHSEPVDTLAVERIEVVKGPATLLYGSNAIGGVVNAISGHDEGAHPGLRGYFSGVGGTNNAQGAFSGGLEYGVKNWTFWGNASTQRTGDYSAGGDFGTVANTFTRSTTGGGGFGYFGKNAFFTTNYGYYQNNYGIPLDPEDPEVRSIKMHRNDVKFNFGYKGMNSFITDMKFTIDISRYQHQELEDDIVGTTFRNNVSSYRGMFEQKAVGKLTGRFGFNGFIRDFSTVGLETLIDGPVKQNSFAAFGLEEFKFERASLQLGARIETNRYDPENAELRNRDFTGFSGAVGARFDLWKGGAFVANYSHGYRAPALEELYNHGPHDGTLAFEIGNPDLHPETSNGIDLSLRHQFEKVKAEANFYYYKFKNFVFLDPTDDIDKDSGFPFAFYLQGDSRFLGTELSLDVAVHKYVNVLTGLDYVNAELTDGRPLPRIPPLRGRIGLDIHYNNFSIRPEFVAVNRQDRVFNDEEPTAGYGTVNVNGTYTISKQHVAHIFSVNAYNLNNKLYFNHISFIKDISPEIGRGVRFSYTVRFF